MGTNCASLVADLFLAVMRETSCCPFQTILNPMLLIWLVGCFGFNGPLRQYFSLYRAVSQREGERKEK